LQDAAAENVLFCIENPKAFSQYEYRNVNCTKKLGRSVLCTSNWAAMKNLADQLIAESS
jgi:hypothetical protein